MSSEKKNHGEAEKKTPAKDGGAANVTMRETTATDKPVHRNFPGPRGAQAPLRVAIERAAHAELIAHAKESLNAEICGVLAGRVCEDDEGLFVHVEAAIRGTAASQGSTHVTFTHATWNAIHQTLERDHPKLKIVGWYHSHPGFGVEFSEMDVFIQKNFFSSPTQVALVIDPLSGNVAVCYNGKSGIEYLPRYWVDGREQEGKTPAKAGAGATATGDSKLLTGDADRQVQALEERVGQLVLAIDDLRSSMYRFQLFTGTLIALAILAVAGYAIYSQMRARVEPPKNVGFVEMPVQIGTNTALLGVQIVQWKLPPEMDIMNQAVARAREELLKELQQLAGMMSTNGSLAFPTNAFPLPKP